MMSGPESHRVRHDRGPCTKTEDSDTEYCHGLVVDLFGGGWPGEVG